MNSRTVRARIVLDEARALGIDLADLIAADGACAALPTLATYLEEIAATFSTATANTYRPTGDSPPPTSGTAASPRSPSST